MYSPLQIKGSNKRGNQVSTMAAKGENLLDLPQLLDTNYAQKIVNYIPQRFGIEKRKGLDVIFERAANYPVTLLKEFASGVWIFGYSTKIEAYDTNTDTFTTIKSDFSDTYGFGGARYGEYFFVCDGVAKIWIIDSTLAISEVAASPEGAKGLKVIGARLFAWYDTTVRYSEIDDAAGIPFTTWTEGTLATDGGSVTYRNAGDVRSIASIGPNIVCFSDKGYFSFTIETFDSGGTVSKTENIGNYVLDFGGATGSIETPVGIFYVNEGGLYQMVSAGQTDTPMSQQQLLITTLLGSKYFEGANQSQVDLVHDIKQKCIFVTLSKNSDTNNFVIGCKLDQGNAMFQIQGWNINRFAKSGENIYGASSVKTSVYKCFEGYDDDGLDIGTEYEQEIKMDNLWSVNKLRGSYAQGLLNYASQIYIGYDIYTTKGIKVKNKRKYLFTAGRRTDSGAGYDVARFDRASYDGSVDVSTLIESFSGNSARISRMQRLIVKFTCADKSPHIINWFSADIENGAPIRRRNMEQII